MERARRRSHGTRTTNGRAALFGGAGGLGMAVVAGLLLLAPSAAASGGSHTYVAPYKSSKSALTDPNTTAGGGSGVQVHASFWHKSTGIAGFSSNASATWWSNQTNNSANRIGEVVLTVPIHVKTNGTYNVTVVWQTVAAGYENLTYGTCSGGSSLYSSCTRAADVFVYGSAVLADKTTGTNVASSNHWPGNHTYISNYTDCYRSSCSSTTQGKPTAALHTGSAFWAFYFNGTSLLAKQKYDLKMTIYGGARVLLETNGGAGLSGARGNAQFNSATLGNEERLYSITVS